MKNGNAFSAMLTRIYLAFGAVAPARIAGFVKHQEEL
jgi:hypothetical protein